MFLKAVHDGDRTAAQKSLSALSGLLDRFALTPAMHRNTAARRKSRLAKRLSKMGTPHHATAASGSSAKGA